MKEKVLIRNNACIKSRIKKDYFLLNLENDNYIKLNESASYIWDLLEEGKTYSELRESINSKFNLKEKDNKDIESFISKCENLEIIKVE